jgi:hypothetical protein
MTGTTDASLVQAFDGIHKALSESRLGLGQLGSIVNVRS